MSQAASRPTGLVAPARPLPATVLAGTSGPAVAATTVQGHEAAIATVDTPPTVDASESNLTVPAVMKPGESTMPASADSGAPVATATTAITGTTATPAPASSATFAKPATTTHLGTPTAFPTGPNPAGGVGGALTALIVVIALILALAWLAKRMPVLGGGVGSNPALRIVGSLALGPRERVVVLAVGDTQLLIGVGAGGTRTLHTLAEPLAASTSAPPAFAQLLAQHFGKKA
ncbi:MAG: flagellar biosynthetic protein FliO [Thermomonas sp.]